MLQAIAYMLAEQNEDAAQMDEPKVVERVALVADDQSGEAAEPGEETINLPATLVPSHGRPSAVVIATP